MATIEVRLLGDASVVSANAALETPPPGVQKLLAYLVVHRDRPCSRFAVFEAIWPESSESRARQRLNTAVWRLRRFLAAAGDGEIILSNLGNLELNADAALWDDVSEFTLLTGSLQRSAAIDAGVARNLEEAIRLYQGDLLDGCYDEWLIRARERILDRYLAALHQLVNWHYRLGNLDQAIEYATKIIDRDSLREEVHRVLIRLYAAQGDRGRALRQYETCVTMLEGELGVAPMPETTLLAAQLRHPTSLEVDLRSDDMDIALSKLKSVLRQYDEAGSMLRATIQLLEGPERWS